MGLVDSVVALHHGEDTVRPGNESAPEGGGVAAVALGDILACAPVLLRAGEATHMFLHEDALSVVAVGVADAVVALLHLGRLVEAGVSDGLVIRWERFRRGLRRG